MAGTFAARMEDLREQAYARDGVIRFTVTVDQRYAHIQHEDLSFRHPRGGHAKYLEQPLLENHRRYLQHYASTVVEGDGGLDAMIASAENLAEDGGVASGAPVEFGDLRASGHPAVSTDRGTLYDRSPRQRRLTEEELAAKSRRLWPLLPAALRGWIYWHNTARGKAGLPPPRRGRP